MGEEIEVWLTRGLDRKLVAVLFDAPEGSSWRLFVEFLDGTDESAWASSVAFLDGDVEMEFVETV